MDCVEKIKKRVPEVMPERRFLGPNKKKRTKKNSGSLVIADLSSPSSDESSMSSQDKEELL
jgi:hypothetical protein